MKEAFYKKATVSLASTIVEKPISTDMVFIFTMGEAQVYFHKPSDIITYRSRVCARILVFVIGLSASLETRGTPLRIPLLRSSLCSRTIIRHKQFALAAESAQIKACLCGAYLCLTPFVASPSAQGDNGGRPGAEAEHSSEARFDGSL